MVDVQLRRAEMGDAEKVFKWRNHPSIVAKGIQQRQIQWEEHVAWFRETVQGSSRVMFILEDGGEAVGQVRFDREPDSQATISVYLAPGLTGRGLGVSGIRRGCWEAFRHWEIDAVIAQVKADNQVARRAFEKAGFGIQKFAASTDQLVEFVFARPADVPHNRLTYGKEEAVAVSDVVASGYWAGGAKVGEFEAALAAVTGRHFALCVGSGLGALRLALLSRGVGPGDTVIVPAYSCVALANAVMAIGAVPLPVDVEPGNWNIDPDRIRESITPTTRAIIAVHTFGAVARTDLLTEWGVPVIEDCAHALGIKYGERLLGSLGTLSIFSFHATKLIGAGEGGALLTDDEKEAKFVRQWRDYEDQPPCGSRLNDKMNNLEATLGLEQLRKLGTMLEARSRIADRYLDKLGRIRARTGGFNLPNSVGGRVWYRFVVEMKGQRTEEVIREMRRYDVAVTEPIHEWLGKERHESFPVAARALASLVSLPLYPTLTDDEQERVCYAFEQVLQKGRG